MYRTLQFRSGWVDDPDFDDADNQTAPGARELADAIVACLAEHVTDLSGVEQHSFYGWGFSCAFHNASFYNVLSPAGHEGYLTTQYLGYWFDKLLFRKPRLRFDVYCNLLSNVLSQVENISEFEWDDYRS